jgi:hypothetical protein
MARRSPNSNRPRRPTSTPARRKGIPLTPLAQRMLHDRQLAGMSERTQESYLRAVRKFAQWLKKAPDQASENDLRRYLLFIKNDQQWEGNSLKVAYSGSCTSWNVAAPENWDMPCTAARPAARSTPCPSPVAIGIVPSARDTRPSSGSRSLLRSGPSRLGHLSRQVPGLSGTQRSG